ncbi:MAG TPA: hypothetical protein ENG66_07445 [Thermococcus sp.]|nr:hypothetical protein [Thermococcus sp.]
MKIKESLPIWVCFDCKVVSLTKNVCPKCNRLMDYYDDLIVDEEVIKFVLRKIDSPLLEWFIKEKKLLKG